MVTPVTTSPASGHRSSELRRHSSWSVPNWAKGVCGFLAAALLWELLRLIHVLPPSWAPSVIDIGGGMFAGLANGTLTAPIKDTLTVWMLGLLIAVAIGITWGIAIGTNRIVAACSRVVVSFLRPIPSVALIPVAILAAGLGLEMVLILVTFAAIWPVLFNAMYGVRDIPEQYLDTSKALGHSRTATLFRVTIVAALPSITTGIRISAGIALVVTMSTELITGIGGLGGYVLNSRISGQIANAYAGLLVGGILGVLVNLVFQLVQRRLLAWSPDNRAVDE